MSKIIFIILMMMSASVMAETSQCVDALTNGQIFKVNIDWNSKSINVNNHRLSVVNETSEGSGVYTNTFINKNRTARYYVISFLNNSTWIHQQYNGYYGETYISGNPYELTCSKSFVEPFLKNKYS